MGTWKNVATSSSKWGKTELDKMCTEDFRKLDFNTFFFFNIGIIPQVFKRRQNQEVLRNMTLGNSSEEKKGGEILKKKSK